MNTNGGFLLDSRAVVDDDAVRGQTTARRDADDNRRHDEEAHSSLQARRLTQKQEVRLMNYLDDAFLELSRGYSKRYTSATTSSVPTLEAYLLRVDSVLAIIAAIPPIGPSAQLSINYLLRYTSELTDGIPGYDLYGGGPGLDGAAQSMDAVDVSTNLQHTIKALDLLDRTWSAILRGRMIDWKQAQHDAHQHAEAATQQTPAFPGVGEGSARGQANATGRYAASAANAAGRHSTDSSRSIIGGRGYATVGQTHRIRLRNVITLAKETLFTWMRTQLDAPLPPQVEGSEQDARAERRALVMAEGDEDDTRREGRMQEEDDKRLESEKRRKEASNAEGMAEHKHYDTLFAKAVDPDASDSDDSADDEDDGHPAPSKRPHEVDSDEQHDSAAQSQHTSKRRELDHETASSAAPTEAESDATFMGMAGPTANVVMRWDVAFARVFSRTLRCLSDIQEQTESRNRSSAKEPFKGGRTSVLETDDGEATQDANGDE